MGGVVQELLKCFDDWLNRNSEGASAHTLLCALVRETLRKAGLPQAAPREFDAQELAAAAGRSEQDDYEASKRWVDRCKVILYVAARQEALEEHFRAAGHQQCLRPAVKSTRGKHRASYFLQPYEMTAEATVEATEPQKQDVTQLHYEFDPPGVVKPSLIGRLLLGSGSFTTKSWRGLVWALIGAAALLLLYVNAATLAGAAYLRRPLQTGDLALLILLGGISWFLWIGVLRPMYWIVFDRIGLAGSFLVAFGEADAQLELTDGQDRQRRLQLVRYRAVCPVCAGPIELLYGLGPNRRRLLGCCSELPQEHVFTFDRVLRRGVRLPSQGA
jgi:hypothetical protein